MIFRPAKDGSCRCVIADAAFLRGRAHARDCGGRETRLIKDVDSRELVLQGCSFLFRSGARVLGSIFIFFILFFLRVVLKSNG